MRLSQGIFFLLQETIYFFHKSMKFFWVLFDGSLGTEFHPPFFLLALHSSGLQTFKRERGRTRY
jgi:hypothetical protein